MGDHTIQCVVTEEEILDLGYTMDDIMSNGEKTQEFMHHIFNMAEKEFHIDLELGVKKVRANFRPNHTIALTFSENHVDVSDLTEEKDEEVATERGRRKNRMDGIMVFDSFDRLYAFSKTVVFEKRVPNCLYRFNGSYVVILDLFGLTQKQVKRMSILAEEYADGTYEGSEKKAFIEEHGKLIVERDALATIKMI